jgi:uncharacterized membrane protein
MERFFTPFPFFDVALLFGAILNLTLTEFDELFFFFFFFFFYSLFLCMNYLIMYYMSRTLLLASVH